MESSEGPAEGGDEVAESSTPRNKVKFLCSYGGKIMPRPLDGLLKYVGGKTRVISISRDITFSSTNFMAKISSEFEKGMILKYQILPEDLDVLVSVTTDEDLRHMIEESDRQELLGPSKFRTFLFPIRDLNFTENRYSDVTNGAGRFKVPTPMVAKSPAYSSSGCSSPKSTSPESLRADTKYYEASGYEGRLPMLKVQSTPNLCGHSSGSLHQYPKFHPQGRPEHYHHLQAQNGSSFCRYDRGRAPGGINHWYANKHSMGSGNSNRFATLYHDEQYSYGYRAPDRVDTHPQSPRSKYHE